MKVILLTDKPTTPLELDIQRTMEVMGWTFSVQPRMNYSTLLNVEGVQALVGRNGTHIMDADLLRVPFFYWHDFFWDHLWRTLEVWE